MLSGRIGMENVHILSSFTPSAHNSAGAVILPYDCTAVLVVCWAGGSLKLRGKRDCLDAHDQILCTALSPPVTFTLRQYPLSLRVLSR